MNLTLKDLKIQREKNRKIKLTRSKRKVRIHLRTADFRSIRFNLTIDIKINRLDIQYSVISRSTWKSNKFLDLKIKMNIRRV